MDVFIKWAVRLGLLAGGAYALYKSVRYFFIEFSFLRNAKKTIGTIVSQVAVTDTSSDDGPATTEYFPVVEFEAADGVIRRVRTTTSSVNKFELGESVYVLFLAKNPEAAQLERLATNPWINLLGAGMGLFLLYCGLILW